MFIMTDTPTQDSAEDFAPPTTPTRVARRGYAAIGLHMPKNPFNVGGALRAAACYDADFIALSGRRYQQHSADTLKAWKHIPMLEGLNDIMEGCPYGAVPVAVDLVEGAVSLPTFVHPERAFYIFGPEDGTLGRTVLDRCPVKLMVPTQYCMNLAATVNVVLYDRMAKRQRRGGSA